MIIYVFIYVCDLILVVVIFENFICCNVNKKLFKYVLLFVFFFLKMFNFWLFVFWKEKFVLSFRFYLMFERYFDKYVLNIEFFFRLVIIIKDCKCIIYLFLDDIL